MHGDTLQLWDGHRRSGENNGSHRRVCDQMCAECIGTEISVVLPIARIENETISTVIYTSLFTRNGSIEKRNTIIQKIKRYVTLQCIVLPAL